jgi:hypothetical protein
MLAIKSFDAHTGRWIVDESGQPVVEYLKHTALERLYPNVQFSFAVTDQTTTPKELEENHPDGQVLVISSGSRFVFAPPEIRDRIAEVFPELPIDGVYGIKDRGAYGALLLGECDPSQQIINVLVVDDKNGSNSQVIDRQTALSLAQETWEIAGTTGQISIDLNLEGLELLKPDKLPQIILPQSAFGDGKIQPGMLSIAVEDLCRLIKIDRFEVAPHHLQHQFKIAIVDDETGDNGGYLDRATALALTGDCHGKMSDRVAQNLFNVDDRTAIQFRGFIPNFGSTLPANNGIHKLAKGSLVAADLSELNWQGTTPPDLVLPKSSFKGGQKPAVGIYDLDIWLAAKDRSQEGKMAISSLVGLYPGAIEDLIPQLEPKMAELAAIQSDLPQLARLYCSEQEKRFEDVLIDADSSLPPNEAYQFIQAALTSGNYSLLETSIATKELEKFLRNQWKDLATGKDRSVSFDRGFAIPSKVLKDGEICVPWLDNGAEIITYRAPLINTNGVRILTNRHLTDYTDSEHQPNYITISDATSKRLGTTQQTVLEDFALDFDGDCLGVALASKYPNLTRDVKLAQLPEHRYPDVVKEQKLEFINTSQEAAALQMRNGCVGGIANTLTRLQSQISAIDIISINDNVVGSEDKLLLANDIKKKLWKITRRCQEYKEELVKRPVNLSAGNHEWFDGLQIGIKAKVDTISKTFVTEVNTQQIFDNYRSILRDLVAVAAYQNQIAVDMPKSARAADAEAVTDLNKFLVHKLPLLKEKKLDRTYQTQKFTIEGYAPQEILADRVNQYWQEVKITPQRPFCFTELFPKNYDANQLAQTIQFKREFDALWFQGTKYLNKERNEDGANLILRTPDRKELEITNLNQFGHPLAYQPDALVNIDINILPNNRETGGIGTYHQAIVLAPNDRGEYQPLGTLCEFSRQREKIQFGNLYQIESCELTAPAANIGSQYFARASDLATDFRNAISPAQHPNYAAALWRESTINGREPKDRISSAMLFAFPTELTNQINNTSLNTHKLSLNPDLQLPDSYLHRPIQIKLVPLDDPIKRAEIQLFSDRHQDFRSLGYLRQDSLPVRADGQIVEATLAKNTGALMKMQIPQLPDVEITFGKVDRHALADTPWIDRPANIVLAPIEVPKYALLDGTKRIGQLDAQSVKFLEQQGRLVPDGKLIGTATLKPNGYNKKIDIAIGSESITLSANSITPNYYNQTVEFAIEKIPEYTVGVHLQNNSGLPILVGEFTTHTTSITGLNHLLAAKILDWAVDERGKFNRRSIPQILQPEFNVNLVAETSKNYTLKIAPQLEPESNLQLTQMPIDDRQLVSRLYARNMPKLTSQTAPPGIKIGSNSPDWLGKQITDALLPHYQQSGNLQRAAIAAFTSNPYLAHRIALNGGLQWLESCHHQGVDTKSKFNGVGRESALLQGIIAGYERSIDSSATQSLPQVEPPIPIPQQIETSTHSPPQIEPKTPAAATRSRKSNVVKKKSEFSR